MATTHVFIVDSNTFKYHLEYLFAGTGAKNNTIDFNNQTTTILHATTENNLLGLIADLSRIRVGDFIIFYVQNYSGFEGRFYGIFKATSEVFLDNLIYLNQTITLVGNYNFVYPRDSKKFKISANAQQHTVEINDYITVNEQNVILNQINDANDKQSIQNVLASFYIGNQFLLKELQKSLTFRINIEPYTVYENGVSEWDALDEIKHLKSPEQMLWSLIYRKLVASRGCTMITKYEELRLFSLIRRKNRNTALIGNNFTFDSINHKIISNTTTNLYTGTKTNINILPRLINKYSRNLAFESHLQAYIVYNIGKNLNTSLDRTILSNLNIQWIGNEVYCGVGLQRIDVMLSLIENDLVLHCVPIELKATQASLGITKQIQRYINWLEQYYLPNSINSIIQPILISKEIPDKTSVDYLNLVNEFNAFNSNNSNHLKLRYIEFSVSTTSINFNVVTY